MKRENIIATIAVGAYLSLLGGVGAICYHLESRPKTPETHPGSYTQVSVPAVVKSDTTIYYRKSVDDDKPWKLFEGLDNGDSMFLEKCTYDFKIEKQGYEPNVKRRVVCFYSNQQTIEFGQLERMIDVEAR